MESHVSSTITWIIWVYLHSHEARFKVRTCIYEAWFVNEYLLFSISGQPQRQEEKRSYPQEFVQADQG